MNADAPTNTTKPATATSSDSATDQTTPYKAVIFDLDGTLADSLVDLASAMNHALEELNLPTIELPRYRSLVGQGLHFLVTHALGPDHPELFDRAVALFRAHYNENMGQQTRIYPGVEELLATLKNQGYKTGVLTNKPHEAALRFMAHHFPELRFDAVIGQKPGVAPKPDPAPALALLETLNIEASQAIYVGDTDVDMRTGRATGMFTVGCTWGFRPDELADTGAQAIIDKPDDLLALLNGEEN